MKLRKAIKKFSCLFLISLLVLTLMSCAEKDESDNDDDKKDDKKQESTTNKKITDVDSLFDAVSSYQEINISEDDINSIIEDNHITYDEIQTIIKEFPSFCVDYSVVVDADYNASYEGESQSEEMAIDINFTFEYDSKTQSLHMGGEYDALGESETIDLWLINEDGTYYGYEKYSDEVASRVELGSLEDAFGDEGIDIEEIMNEYDTMMSDYSELLDSVEVDNNEFIAKYREMFSLKEGTTKYDGNECYNLVMTFDLYDTFNKAKESDELKELLEEMDMDFDINEIDQYLDEELFSGYTINDILKLVKFDINYYVSTDLNYYSLKCDATDCTDNLLEVVEEFLLYSEAEIEGMEIDLNCNELSVEMNCEIDADVNVTFDGEYEEY